MTALDALLTSQHPLRADADAPAKALMLARSRASFAWGRLQGLAAHPDPQGAELFFAANLIRQMLTEALLQAGYTDAKPAFDRWFCGIGVHDEPTTNIVIPASEIADAMLAELSHSPWACLAHSAATIRKAAKYNRGNDNVAAVETPAHVIAQATALVAKQPQSAEDSWPLAMLDGLHVAAAKSMMFMPAEPERRTIVQGERTLSFDPAPVRTPLWAIDLLAGQAIAKSMPGTLPLPCPGAIRAEALAPWLWPRERGILVADAIARTSEMMIALLESARAHIRHITHALPNLRSSSRAPQLYRLLAGFGPLRPIQIEAALGVSKNGVRELTKTLSEADLVEPAFIGGQLLLSAVPLTVSRPGSVEHVDERADPAGRFAEFDAALADIDRLLDIAAS